MHELPIKQPALNYVYIALNSVEPPFDACVESTQIYQVKTKEVDGERGRERWRAESTLDLYQTSEVVALCREQHTILATTLGN